MLKDQTQKKTRTLLFPDLKYPKCPPRFFFFARTMISEWRALPPREAGKSVAEMEPSTSRAFAEEGGDRISLGGLGGDSRYSGHRMR